MMDMSKDADLIITYGPPHSGKTFWCHRCLKNFTRIDPVYEFQQDPSLTVRQLVISKIISLLKKGTKVVIDDENGSYVKRDSYISLVKNKIPDCKILCVCFHPKHGKQQLLWTREYSFVDVVLRKLTKKTCDADVNRNLAKTDREIQKWMEETDQLEPPRMTEGYWKIEKLTTDVSATSKYKLELPALFIEWGGLFDQTSGELLPKVSETFTLWYEQNPCGRIIIVCDSKTMTSEQLETKEKTIRHVLLTIVQKLSVCPVYLISIVNQIESGDFSSPPSPGLLIFLQKLHYLDFMHKGTSYLYHSPAHSKMADKVGIKHIKASKVFARPDLVQKTRSFTTAPIPSMLRETKVHFDSEDASLPIVPLRLIAEGDLPFASVKLGSGRYLYMAAKSQHILNKYQDEYGENATLSSEKESRLNQIKEKPLARTSRSESGSSRDGSVRPLPGWMKKGRSTERAQLLTPKRRKTKKSDSITAANAPLYVMNMEELGWVASETLEQAGESISNLLESDVDNKPSALSEFFNVDISPKPHSPSPTTTHEVRKTSKIRVVEVKHSPKNTVNNDDSDESSDTDQSESPKSRGLLDDILHTGTLITK